MVDAEFKMDRFFLLILFSVISLAANCADTQSDLQRLQGKWMATAATRDGKPVPADEVAGRMLLIKNDRYVLVNNGTVVERGFLTLGPTQSPKTLDTTAMVGGDGDLPQVPARWIYSFEGDKLRLRGNGLPGKPRPQDFSSRPGDSFFTIEYRRAKP